MMDGNRVRITIEGLGPLVMNVVRDAWERTHDGRIVRTPEPDSDRGRANLRLSLDDCGRPALRWSHLLWLVGGKSKTFDESRARREMGLDVEDGGLAIVGNWEPLRRPTSLFGVRGEEVVAVFPTWAAGGVVVCDPALWPEDGLRHALEFAGRGIYRLSSYMPLDAVRGGA